MHRVILSSGDSQIVRDLPANSFQIHVSPDGQRVVYTEVSGAVFELELTSKSPPIVLVGAINKATDIDFLSGTDTIIAHDFGTRLWPLFGGVPIALSESHLTRFQVVGTHILITCPS